MSPFRCILKSNLPMVDGRGEPTLTQLGREIPAGATLNVYGLEKYEGYPPGIVNVSAEGMHTIHPLFARYEDVLRACGQATSIGQVAPFPGPAGTQPTRTVLDVVRQRATAGAIGGSLATLGTLGLVAGSPQQRRERMFGSVGLIAAGLAALVFAHSAEA